MNIILKTQSPKGCIPNQLSAVFGLDFAHHFASTDPHFISWYLGRCLLDARWLLFSISESTNRTRENPKTRLSNVVKGMVNLVLSCYSGVSPRKRVVSALVSAGECSESAGGSGHGCKGQCAERSCPSGSSSTCKEETWSEDRWRKQSENSLDLHVVVLFVIFFIPGNRLTRKHVKTHAYPAVIFQGMVPWTAMEVLLQIEDGKHCRTVGHPLTIHRADILHCMNPEP